MKRTAYLLICVILLFTVCTACGPKEDPNTDEYDRNKGLDPDASTAFFDDFTDRQYSASIWNVQNSKWGPAFNHGVRPENVLWNDSGIVTLKSYGKYYSDPDKTCQGGVLITKDAYGPGRYEARMKIVPRFGACTAFWTFMYGNAQDLNGVSQENLNQEIDIELNVGNDFQDVWLTNWVTENNKAHVEKSTEAANNDGEWHLYTFEWHTDPMRVDYYVDDVLLYTSKSYVPYVAGVINVGNWFPDGWAGDADFEQDYMQVDYVRYTPYRNQPCTPYEAGGGGAAFPAESTPLPEAANLISNAGFENSYAIAGKETAWSLYQSAAVTAGAGRSGKGMTVNEDAVASQIITGASQGFEYRLTAWVKLGDAASVGNLCVYFLKESTEYVGTPVKVAISSAAAGYAADQFFPVELTFRVPQDARRLEIAMETDTGALIFDDLFLNLTKKLS